MKISETENAGEKLVTVKTCASIPEAMAARTALESSGIPVFQEPGRTKDTWFTTSHVAGLELRTFKAYADAARDILASGDDKVIEPRPSRSLAYIILVIFAIYLIL